MAAAADTTATATATATEQDTVQWGDTVVLRLNDGAKYLITEVTRDSDPGAPPAAANSGVVRLARKSMFDIKNLVGCHYGRTFEVDPSTGKLQPFDASALALLQSLEADQSDDDGGADDDTADETKDNRNIAQDGLAQQLNEQELLQLKADLPGSEYVRRVAANNAAFSLKTKFAKEKYLARKQKKHLFWFKIQRPSARTICEAYFAKNPTKISHLRGDSLSHLLTMANIHAHSTSLVFETCNGLVTGAIAERLGGYGAVVSIYPGPNTATLAALEAFNFPHSISKAILDVPLGALPLIYRGDPLPEDRSRTIVSESEEYLLEHRVSIPRRWRSPLVYQRIQTLLRERVDSLIIASRFDSIRILSELFQFLADSGTLVVFGTSVQPLVECHEMLNRSGQAIDVQLAETWTREQQVLTDRTHPTMRMHAASGYLLTATKVGFVKPKRALSSKATSPTTITSSSSSSSSRIDSESHPHKKQRITEDSTTSTVQQEATRESDS